MSEQKNLEESQQTLSYPAGIDQVPYASFMKIEKYEYQEGLAKVAANQNDALGAYQRSAVMKGMVNTATNVMSGVYVNNAGLGGDADYRMNEIADDIAASPDGVSTKRRRWDFWGWAGTGKAKTEVPGGDNEIALPNGETTTFNELKNDKDELRDRRRKGLQASELNIALPEEFTYEYKANWNNTFKMGTMALMADNAAKFAALGLAGAGGGALFTNTMGRLQKASGVIGKAKGKIPGGGLMPSPDEYAANMAKGAQMATNPFGVNGKLDATNIAGLGGMVPNENAIQMFQNIDFRKFSLSFTLASRNPREAEEIQTIIEWFKRGMHPASKNAKGSAVMLTFPDIFVLKPMFVKVNDSVDNNGKRKLEIADEPIQHPMMPRTKLVALTSMRVNATPLSAINTTFDGSVPLVTVELGFDETTALTRADFEGARKRSSKKALDKGFVKSSLMANHPTISY